LKNEKGWASGRLVACGCLLLLQQICCSKSPAGEKSA
jgi:hypothetical protein